MARARQVSKKHKFVKDGVFFAELNDFLAKELAEDGYAGCEVRVTPVRTEVIIHATKTLQVVGNNGQKIRELTTLVQKRFKFQKDTVKLFAEQVKNRGLSALAQAEAVRYRLFEGLSVRRACYSVLKFIMDRGAKGCEVVVSGKLRGQRAKSMKFRDGYMIHAGDATNYYIDHAVKHVHLRQGVLGIKVKIMLPHDPTGAEGIKKDLPDAIQIRDPKDVDPLMEDRNQLAAIQAVPQQAQPMADIQAQPAPPADLQAQPYDAPQTAGGPYVQEPQAPAQFDQYAAQPPQQQPYQQPDAQYGYEQQGGAPPQQQPYAQQPPAQYGDQQYAQPPAQPEYQSYQQPQPQYGAPQQPPPQQGGGYYGDQQPSGGNFPQY